MSWLAQNWIRVAVAIGIAWLVLGGRRANGYAGAGLLQSLGSAVPREQINAQEPQPHPVSPT